MISYRGITFLRYTTSFRISTRSLIPNSRMSSSPAFVSSPLSRLLPRRPRPHSRSICTASLPTLESLSRSLRTGETSVTDILTTYLTTIQSLDPTINAFLTLDIDALQARAAHLDKMLKSGTSPGPLTGLPIAIKDNICTHACPTTAASAILDQFTPAYNATVVQKLHDAGAVILGKTNLDEFGMGSSCETSAYAITRNPWDLQRVPGGSSGGSAAAVASGMAPAALGTDTGGSIRQPAGFCGITGLKPSYGRVSRHGLIAHASSLDVIGPMCRTARDCATVLGVIAGVDNMDATSVNAPVPDYTASLDGTELNGVTVGVVSEAMAMGVDDEVRASVESAVDTLRGLGAEVRSVSLPLLAEGTPAYYVLATSEASANLARYDGVRFGVRDTAAENSADMYARSRAKGFGDEVKRRILLGTYALSSGYYDAYYRRAQQVRALVTADIKRVFGEDVDVLVTPVSATAAYKLGEKVDDPVSMYLDDVMTIPASLAGLPALSVPCGLMKGRLPVGMQVIGPFLGEEMVLRVGDAFQRATEHHLQTADIRQSGVAAAAV